MFLKRVPQRRSDPLVIVRGTCYPHDITDDVNFDYLVKVVFASFLYCKVVIFPFSHTDFCK